MTEKWVPKGMIGVVHLPALPGDPCYRGRTIDDILAAAMQDANALATGGVDAIIVENFFSAPFPKGTPEQPIPPHHIAFMTLVARALKQNFPKIKVGINCLRNDARAAIGIATITNADFVRINVHTGAYVTDQGVIEGNAYDTLRYRHELSADHIAILADVLVKHATPLAPISAEDATKDTLERGLADAVIVTGSGTGQPVDRKTLEEVYKAAGNKPVLLGSGTKFDTMSIYAPFIDGAIVGTSIKKDGIISNPVDVERVKNLSNLIHQIIKSNKI